MIFPEKLSQGDTVALLAPSGVCNQSRILPAMATLEKWGLKVLLMPSCKEQSHPYLAGSDSMRAQDLMNAFTAPYIRGIFAFRGGYGAQRILPLLDYEAISKNPKIFAGYSDITALHIAINQRCGFVTYHSPMPGTELYKEDIDLYTVDSLKKQIFEDYESQSQDFQEILEKPDSIKVLVKGNAEGTLIGGNLSLLVSSLGTPYEIDTRGKILFIEEITEEPYRIDRMLLQLKLSGKLTDCNGIMLGSFFPETYETLSQIIEDLLVPLEKPLWANLACGHCIPTMTLPLGAKVCMKQ